jgi:hypothetical protein
VKSLPPELDALVAKMLTKAPDDRTPSAAWALAALERVALPTLDGIEVELVMQAPPTAEVAAVEANELEEDGEDDSFPWVPVLVIVIALAIAGAAVYFIGLRGDEKLTP